jgi:penicillin-binding protein 2
MGTNPVFDDSTFPIAGKTGTATAARANQEPTAWFVSFGPMPHPQYVVLCVVDQGGYGAQAAAPAVKAIYQYLQTNPVKPVTMPSAAHQPKSSLPHTNLPEGVTTTTTSTSTPKSSGTLGTTGGTGTTGTRTSG